MKAHAIGKSQFGGVHVGFESPLYHSPGRKSAPAAAGAAQAARKVRKRSQSISATVADLQRNNNQRLPSCLVEASPNCLHRSSGQRQAEVHSDPVSLTTEGLLLYPSIGLNIDETALIQGHRVRLVTIDLSRTSAEIIESLRKIPLLSSLSENEVAVEGALVILSQKTGNMTAASRSDSAAQLTLPSGICFTDDILAMVFGEFWWVGYD